jgi:riboflavin synthase
MFTGLVQDIGTVLSTEARGGDLRLVIGVSGLDLARHRLGDSIAVAGVCLTVVALDARSFAADLSRETLAQTTAGSWNRGQRLNLEPALRAGDALGGHFVAGHVDGVAEVVQRDTDARSLRLLLRVPAALRRYLARKGSVTIDGVSLTVNAIVDDMLAINLVPHTLAVTTLGELQAGNRVNLEIDLMARYAERLLADHSRVEEE